VYRTSEAAAKPTAALIDGRSSACQFLAPFAEALVARVAQQPVKVTATDVRVRVSGSRLRSRIELAHQDISQRDCEIDEEDPLSRHDFRPRGGLLEPVSSVLIGNHVGKLSTRRQRCVKLKASTEPPRYLARNHP
jgi:hypothetical protein